MSRSLCLLIAVSLVACGAPPEPALEHDAGPSGDAGPRLDGGGSEALEACDGLDDDGDGDVDEGCPCELGATQACYGGPPENAGVGTCELGEQTCEGTEEFPRWGDCDGWTAPNGSCGAADLACPEAGLGDYVGERGAAVEPLAVAVDPGGALVELGYDAGRQTGYLQRTGANAERLWSIDVPVRTHDAPGWEHYSGADVATDAAGNIAMVAPFTGEAAIEGVSLQARNAVDVLVASFTPNGVLRWATRLGEESSRVAADGTLAIAGGPDGSVHVLAPFEADFRFGAETVAALDGRRSYVLASFDGEGQPRFARRLAAASDATVRRGRALAIATNHEGAIFTVARSSQTPIAGVPADVRWSGVVFGRFHPDGEHVVSRGVRSLGTHEPTEDWSLDIAVDGRGRAYITARSVVSATYTDMLVGIDSYGESLFERPFVSTEYSRALALGGSLAGDPNGGVYVVVPGYDASAIPRVVSFTETGLDRGDRIIAGHAWVTSIAAGCGQVWVGGSLPGGADDVLEHMLSETEGVRGFVARVAM